MTVFVAIAYTVICLGFCRSQQLRDVAQFGSAPRSGRGGRGFESRHPDLKGTHHFAGQVYLLIVHVNGLCVACC